MELSTLVSLIGMILFNVTLLFAAWIKVKTDIAALNIIHEGFEIRLTAIEVSQWKSTDKMEVKVDNLSKVNEMQHQTISDKIDNLNEIITEWKIETLKSKLEDTTPTKRK